MAEINPSTNSRLNPANAIHKLRAESASALDRSGAGGVGRFNLDNERWDDVAERVVADDFYTAHTVISLLKWRVCRKAVVL